MVQLKMDAADSTMSKFTCAQYASQLALILRSYDWRNVEALARKFSLLREQGKCIYICGNGGSAGNAQHLANDFLYGVSPKTKKALRVEALSANASVLTCLGNDVGYHAIFSHQLEVKGQPGDMLLVLSGSGNSENIVEALNTAKQRGMETSAILGYDGGKSKQIADSVIHFNINDMQISEDLQLIVGHMLMRLLRQKEIAC